MWLLVTVTALLFVTNFISFILLQTMPAFANRALQIPDNELAAAKEVFCHSALAKSSYGDTFLCTLARSTLKGYTSVFRKYIHHLRVNNVVIYPPTELTWTSFMDFIPSQSREMMSRAKSALLLFCKVNSIQLPQFVSGYFDGMKRIRVPVKKPSKRCSLSLNTKSASKI